jgi:YHS domain-containing protein
VVSYHKNKAIEGNVNYKVNHKGAVYLFDNEANKSTFEANPEKFIPQYGGWCAYAMGNNGKKVAINPEAFTIEDGKLYLLYKTLFTDTREKWMENTSILKPEADLNWKKIKTQ